MPPLRNQTIQIVIMDDRHTEECGAGCSLDWSLPDSLALAREQAEERFSEQVKIEYLNLSLQAAKGDMLKWKEEIRNKNLLLPLLLVNGHLRISGPFDMRQLMETIEIETEIRI